MKPCTIAALSVLASAACGDGGTSPIWGRAGAVTPPQSVIVGQVIGLYDFRPVAPGDSEQTSSQKPIAQARVDLYLVRLLPIEPGTDTLHVVPAFVATTTSDADGNFQFTTRAGIYLLEAAAPAGSGFGTTANSGSVVQSTDDGGVIRIWLFPIP
jgi:hypothetical protein